MFKRRQAAGHSVCSAGKGEGKVGKQRCRENVRWQQFQTDRGGKLLVIPYAEREREKKERCKENRAAAATAELSNGGDRLLVIGCAEREREG